MSSVYFNGTQITIPGAYSTIDASSMGTKTSSDATKIIAIIGESGGGEPGALQVLSNPVTAKKVLKSGELLKACNKAWNPVSASKAGVATGGADTIVAIRTNEGTKASLTTENGSLVIESSDWNADANQIEVKIESGTYLGTKTVTVHDQTSDTYEKFADIGGLFTLAYSGSSEYAAVSVVLDDSTQELYLQTKVGASASSAVEDLHITIGYLTKPANPVIKTVKALIEAISVYENYTVVKTKGCRPATDATQIERFDNFVIKTGTTLSQAPITAVHANVKDIINDGSNLIRVTSFDITKEIANMAYTSLTGGTNGTSPASWVKFFDLLSTLNVYYIVPLTSDLSIQAELLSHVSSMSGTKGRERRMIIGGDIGESIDDSIERATAFSNTRVQVVHGGFYDYNSDNELELYAPYILAAQHAGRCANLEDGESATHDTYIMSAPEEKISDDDIKRLLSGGVLAFEYVLDTSSVSSSYVRLVQDLTTDVASTASVYTERATGALADSINQEIRTNCDSLLTGKKTGVSDLTTVQNAVISVLYARKLKNQIVEYKDVYVSKSGTVTTINYSVAPCEINNFTLITAHYYSESISTSEE